MEQWNRGTVTFFVIHAISKLHLGLGSTIIRLKFWYRQSDPYNFEKSSVHPLNEMFSKINRSFGGFLLYIFFRVSEKTNGSGNDGA